MTLKEKFQEKPVVVYQESFKLTNQSAELLEEIADEFAIGFAEWTWNKELIIVNDCDYFEYKFNLYTRKKLLEMYKKEKGLC
jgi:hypothetical protein